MRRIFLCLAVILLSTAAFAGDKETTAEDVAVAQKVLAATPDGAQYWTVLDNGVVRHKNSGLTCGPKIGDLPLIALLPGPASPMPDGSVDCPYSDAEQSVGYDVYAYTLGKAFGGEDAFNAHHQGVMVGPGHAVSIKTFPVFDIPEAKGEAFVITVGGKRQLHFLCTGVVNRWVIAVLFTTVPLPDDASQDLTEKMADALSQFPKAVAYRAIRGVAFKELAKPDPADGF